MATRRLGGGYAGEEPSPMLRFESSRSGTELHDADARWSAHQMEWF